MSSRMWRRPSHTPDASPALANCTQVLLLGRPQLPGHVHRPLHQEVRRCNATVCVAYPQPRLRMPAMHACCGLLARRVVQTSRGQSRTCLPAHLPACLPAHRSGTVCTPAVYDAICQAIGFDMVRQRCLCLWRGCCWCVAAAAPCATSGMDQPEARARLRRTCSAMVKPCHTPMSPASSRA